jgi:hypothetical protein
VRTAERLIMLRSAWLVLSDATKVGEVIGDKVLAASYPCAAPIKARQQRGAVADPGPLRVLAWRSDGDCVTIGMAARNSFYFGYHFKSAL